MSRTKRRNNSAARSQRTLTKRKPSSAPITTKTVKTSNKAWMLVFAVVLGLAIAVLIGIAVVDTNDSPRRAPAMGSDLVQVIQQDYRMRAVQASMKPVELVRWDLAPQTLNELLDLPSDQLHRVDIARMNLLCASRLPSTEGLDIDHALATLDAWAERVAFETERHLYRVNDPRYAETYGGSEAQFRAAMLAQVLQEDLGVKYNMTAEGNFSFADPSVAFIHGMIPPEGKTTADTPGGTCASMPVLYVAVGRRLGYPLKLATTDSHIFVRWDGKDHEKPGFRGYFNCETTNGFVRLDDDYYRTWPYPVTDQQIAVNGFLQSLSPAEEMAQFMAARGHHGMDVGQIGFAARCYENAYRYDRRRPCYRSWFMAAATRTNYEPVTPTLRHMLASLPMQPRRGVRSHVPPTFGTPTPSQTRSRLTPGIPLPPSHPGFGTHRRQDPPFGAVPRVVQPPSPTTYYDPYYQSPR